MNVVDLNVLLYAVNSSSAHHKVAKSWWEDALSGEETVGLSWIVLLGFLRLTTRSGLFENPLSPEEALARVQTWLDWPTTRVVGEGEDHFRIPQPWCWIHRDRTDAANGGNSRSVTKPSSVAQFG